MQDYFDMIVYYFQMLFWNGIVSLPIRSTIAINKIFLIINEILYKIA